MNGALLALLGARAAAPAGITPTLIGNYASDATSPNYTFPVNLGTPAANRTIIVALGTRATTTAVPSMTVGGVAATRVHYESSGGDQRASIWYAQVPTGTTVNVVVSTGSSYTRLNATVMRVDGTLSASGTPAVSLTNGGALTVSIPAGGFLVATSTAYGATESTVTWTGVTPLGATIVSDGIIYTSTGWAATGTQVAATWSVATDPPTTIAAAFTAA